MPGHRWEGIDDDAEVEGSWSFTEDNKVEDEPGEITDRAANFNPFDEDKFEANIS